VRQRFLSLTRRAIAGELDAWDAEPTRDLALVLLGKSPRLLGKRNNQRRSYGDQLLLFLPGWWAARPC
jgi:uncharacterized protein (DUF924 family)